MAVNLPDGWLTPAEANELRRISHGRSVLELGAWKGRSTVVFAETASYVVSVDSHHGIAEVGGEDSLPDYLLAVRDLPNVAIIVAAFADIVPRFGPNAFDVVYIDGNHDATSVRHDTVMAAPLARYALAFHDWDMQSVRDTVVDVMQDQPTTVVGSVAVYGGTDGN